MSIGKNSKNYNFDFKHFTRNNISIKENAKSFSRLITFFELTFDQNNNKVWKLVSLNKESKIKNG